MLCCPRRPFIWSFATFNASLEQAGELGIKNMQQLQRFPMFQAAAKVASRCAKRESGEALRTASKVTRQAGADVPVILNSVEQDEMLLQSLQAVENSRDPQAATELKRVRHAMSPLVASASMSSNSRLSTPGVHMSAISFASFNSSRDSDRPSSITGREFTMSVPRQIDGSSSSNSKLAMAAVYSDYEPTVDDLLLHPLAFELLKDQLMRTHSVENALFLIQLNKWKLIRSKELKAHVSLLIFEEFIVQGSPNQINVLAAQRKVLEGKFKAQKKGVHDAGVFDAVEKEVRSLVDSNAMAAFKASGSFALAKQILIRNAVLFDHFSTGAGNSC